MTLEEKKKIFEDGIEKGRFERNKEIDQVWDLYFELLGVTDDLKNLLIDAKEVIDEEGLEMTEGWSEFAVATIDIAEEITEILHEDGGCDDGTCPCCGESMDEDELEEIEEEDDKIPKH